MPTSCPKSFNLPQMSDLCPKRSNKRALLLLSLTFSKVLNWAIWRNGENVKFGEWYEYLKSLHSLVLPSVSLSFAAKCQTRKQPRFWRGFCFARWTFYTKGLTQNALLKISWFLLVLTGQPTFNFILAYFHPPEHQNLTDSHPISSSRKWVHSPIYSMKPVDLTLSASTVWLSSQACGLWRSWRHLLNAINSDFASLPPISWFHNYRDSTSILSLDSCIISETSIRLRRRGCIIYAITIHV